MDTKDGWIDVFVRDPRMPCWNEGHRYGCQTRLPDWWSVTWAGSLFTNYVGEGAVPPEVVAAMDRLAPDRAR